MRSQNTKKDVALLGKLVDMHWPFMLVVIGLATLGFAMMYSAAGGNWQPWASRQLSRFVIGLALLFIIILLPAKFWMRMGFIAFFGGIIFLLVVDIMGHTGMGAQRWVSIGGITLQPSELMKVAVIMVIASYYHYVKIEYAEKPVAMLIPFILMAIPAALILRQPNLGTASILLMMGSAMMLVAGASTKKFILLGAMLLAFLPMVWTHMHDYQKRRVMTFINPEADPLGAGYNILQSKIAIGSGGFLGKGYMNGSQSQLNFLPEKQTDFVFTMIAEEFGFIGSFLVLVCYGALLTWGCRISMSCKSRYCAVTAYGVTALLFIHIFINVGMVMGLLPVVGVPLPLLSYGGSNMLATMMAFGFLMNAHVNRNTII